MKNLLGIALIGLMLGACGVLGPSSRSGSSASGTASDASGKKAETSKVASASTASGTTASSTTGTPARSSSTRANTAIRSSERTTEGIASWYGGDFHGKQTASGEIYDMNARTAAHRSLPFNTKVRVTNLINNQFVEVRINDRGPFTKDRVIDLSRAAAESIDMIGIGTAPVLVEVIAEGDRPVNKENLNSTEIFTVQLGSFSTRTDATSRSNTIRGSRVVEVEIEGRTYYRVYFKTYRTRFLAEEALRKLESSGFEGFVRQIEL